MSSSHIPPDEASLRTALDGAVRETVEAFGDSVLPVPEAAFDEGDSGVGETLTIAAAGALNGTFILRCSTPAAAGLTELMLGDPGEPGSEDRQDALGEILNMIVGSVKRSLSGEPSYFSLSVPSPAAVPAEPLAGSRCIYQLGGKKAPFLVGFLPG